MESCEMIKDLMENMGRLGLTAVDVDFPDGLKVSLKKEGQLVGAGTSVVNFGNTGNADGIDNVNNADTTCGSSNIGNVNNISSVQKVIKSPMVGTFYLKPAPTSEPYVKIGDKVSVGQTVCIVEAMKLMNEIESEFDGEICEIYVKDGEVVEYGTPLFGVK